MSNGVENNNDLWKKLQETALQDSWMQELYGTTKTNQQNEIKKIFTVVADNNLNETQKNALLARAETLQEKVERLEAKMAVLEEALAKNQEEIDSCADEITNLVLQSEKKSKEMQTTQEAVVRDVTDYCLDKLKNGTIEPDEFAYNFYRLLDDNYQLKRDKNAMENILGNLESKQAEVDNIIGKADKWLQQRNLLEAQYGATKSTYDLLQMTASRIGKDSTTYTNTDYNTQYPIYSPEKINVVNEFSENATINVEPGENKNYIKGSKAPNLLEMGAINEKYKDLLGTKATGSDNNRITNEAVQNLGKALDIGLIEDLCAAGFSLGATQDFIVENFSGAEISQTDGRLNIPKGHDDQATVIYNKLDSKIKNYRSGFEGVVNTWDKFGGNTIESNKQINSLANNYENIITKLSQSGFTFKEAMFAMFDPKYGIFKNSGVVYNVDDQSEKPNYYIKFAGDETTANMYQNLANMIYDTWGVKALGGVDSGRFDDEEIKDPKRTDPLSFSLDNNNNQFTFIIDRNNDNAFNDATEFVGATGDWLEDMKQFDTDENGIIEGAELKNVKLLNTKFNDNVESISDNNEFTPNKTESNKNYERSVSTKVDYKFVNANDLGIESIDLNNAVLGETTGKFDANRSEIFNQSITFNVNGYENPITASRKDEADTYMKAIYGDVYGKGTKIGFSDTQVQEVLDKDYGEFNKFNNRYAITFANIELLKSLGNVTQQARELYERTLANINDIHTTGYNRANNEALSYKEVPSWNSVRSEVQSLVNSENLPYVESQLKGIFIFLHKGATAREVVDEYKSQIDLENKSQKDKDVNKNAWKTMVLACQEGIPLVLSDAIAELENGKTPEKIIADLKATASELDTNTIYKEIDFNPERENELMTSFNTLFNEAGHSEKVVEALALLCELQQENENYMLNKSGEQLAKDIMKKMGLN